VPNWDGTVSVWDETVPDWDNIIENSKSKASGVKLSTLAPLVEAVQ
jgi:hypothetical protein